MFSTALLPITTPTRTTSRQRPDDTTTAGPNQPDAVDRPTARYTAFFNPRRPTDTDRLAGEACN